MFFTCACLLTQCPCNWTLCWASRSCSWIVLPSFKGRGLLMSLQRKINAPPNPISRRQSKFQQDLQCYVKPWILWFCNDWSFCGHQSYLQVKLWSSDLTQGWMLIISAGTKETVCLHWTFRGTRGAYPRADSWCCRYESPLSWANRVCFGRVEFVLLTFGSC